MTQLLCRSYQLDGTDIIANTLVDLAGQEPRIFAFYGPLGAGKTTLIKKVIASLLEIDASLITSPTFNYVNTYNNKRQTAHHFDLYRLKTLASFEAMGFADYLDQTCFIEWPEILSSLLPQNTIHIHIDYEDEGRAYHITQNTTKEAVL